MGFASLRFRRSMATRWKMRLFLRPCNEKRRRTGIENSLPLVGVPIFGRPNISKVPSPKRGRLDHVILAIDRHEALKHRSLYTTTM
jgi:hypothetical protein